MLPGCPKDLKYTSIIQVTACFIRTLPRSGSHGVIPKRVGHLVKYWSTQRSKLTLNCISSCGRVVRSWFFWIWRISGKKKRSVQDWLSWARESRRSIEVKNSFIIWTRRGTSSQVPQLPWMSSSSKWVTIMGRVRKHCLCKWLFIKFTLFSHHTTNRMLCQSVNDRVKIYWY